MDLNEFEEANPHFKKLVATYGRGSFEKPQNTDEDPKTLEFNKNNLSEVNQAFAWCHQHIYRKDNISQSEAFSEFVKLISLKLVSDSNLEEEFPGILAENTFKVPAAKVKFSTFWIESQKINASTPTDKIQFQESINEMER